MLKRFLIALAVIFAPIAVAACQVPGTDTTLVSPVVDGASVQQNAYAALAAYAEVADEAATIAEAKDTPETVKSTLKTMVLNADPVVQLVTDGFQKYDAALGRVKAAKDTGAGNLEVLLSEAGKAYSDAMGLWQEHGNMIQSFPGWVEAVKSSK